jgi:hypothetical protein
MRHLCGLGLLTVLVMGFSAVAQEAAPTAATSNPYFPLKTGGKWIYNVQGGPVEVTVTGTEKVKDATGYKLETKAGGKISASEVVGSTVDGIVRYNVNGLTPDAPILFLPADPLAKKEWTVDTKASGQTIKGTFKASKVKETIGTTTYDDVIYIKGTDMQVGGASTTIEYWFAKNVGIVKLRFTLGSQDATLELKEYVPGK